MQQDYYVCSETGTQLERLRVKVIAIIKRKDYLEQRVLNQERWIHALCIAIVALIASIMLWCSPWQSAGSLLVMASFLVCARSW